MRKRLFRVNAKLIKDYTAVLTGTGIGRALSFLISVILARSLDTAGFGLYSLFFTVMILTWQLPNVIDLTYVRYAKAEAYGNRIAYLRASSVIKGVIFAFLIILSYPLSHLLAYYVFAKPDSVFFIKMAIISGGLLSLFSTLAGIYQAQGNFVKFSLVNTLFYLGVILIITIFVLFRLPFTPTIAVWINTLVALIAGCFGIIYLYKKIEYIFPIHISSLLKMLQFGKWLLAAGLTYTIFQRLDILVLARYVDYDQLGVYSAAVRIMMVASLFTSSVSAVLLPRGSEALNSLQQLKSYLKESLMVSFGLVVIVGIIMAICPPLLKALFGARYLGALLPSRILLLTPAFTVLYTPFSYLFYAENKSKTVFELGMIILVAVISALLFLVPRFGPMGAAVSIAFSSFCGLIFVAVKSVKTIKKAYDKL